LEYISDAPGDIPILAEFLLGEGFKIDSNRGEGSANCVLEFQRHTCGVRVGADRGRWWVELGPGSPTNWFDPDLWEACLDGGSVRSEPSGLEKQISFVMRRWREVAKAMESARTLDCLHDARSRRARQRLGLS
jgi:hypothetical protein